MKKVNLNQVIKDLQGRDITSRVRVDNKSTEVRKTIKSVLSDCLTRGNGPSLKPKEGRTEDMKLASYKLAEKIEASDSITFNEEEAELIMTSIKHLPTLEYGFICNALSV